jgi:PAS domain S-box-containing protein
MTIKLHLKARVQDLNCVTWRWAITFLIVCGFSLGSASARTFAEIQQSGSLRLCVAGASATFYQANGEALAKALNLKPEVTRLKEWDQQFQNNQGKVVKEATYVAQLLASENCDVFPNDLHVLDWRSSKMDLVPYYTARKVVVAHRDQKALRSVDDLKGHRAAVQKETAYDTWLMEQNRTRFASSPVVISYMPTAEAMAAVASKAADFTVVGAEAAFKWVRSDLDNLDILFPVDAPVSVAWGIHPRAEGLRPRLEQFFKDSARVGSDLDRSWRQQYGISLMEYQLFDASYAASGLDIKKWLVWILPVGAGLLGAVVAVIFWNRRLKREIAERKAAELRSRELAELAAHREQLNIQVAEILLNLQRVGSYAELAQAFFSGTAALFELGQASLYRVDNASQCLSLCTGYARVGDTQADELIEFGVGLVGQCALEKRVLVINAPPPDYLSIRSALGTATPKTIVLVPVLSTDQLLGVIELACLKSFGEEDQSLLDRFLPMIAMSMEILARNQSTQRLLNATQEQAEVLEKQGGEIERLLKEQEGIFQNAPHGIIYTGDGIMLRANQRVADYFGTTIDQLVGQPSESIYSSIEDFRKLGSIVGPQLAAGKDVHLEWQFVRKDGSPFFAMISGQGIQLAGHARAAVWMFEDISERKKLEQSMKDGETRLRQILENSPAGVSINNEAGVPTFSNRRVAELLGIPPEAVGKGNTRQWWRQPTDREAFLEQIRRDGRVVDYKADFVRTDGTVITVLLSSTFMEFSDGRQLVTWIYDISQREMSESALRQAIAEQTAIFETARIGIALTKDRIIVRCNPYIEQVFGYAPGELIGKSTRVMFPDDASYAEIGQGMLAAFGRGETFRYEVEYMRKDGSRFRGRVHGSMVDFKDPSRGVVLMGEDSSEEQRAKELAEKATEATRQGGA